MRSIDTLICARWVLPIEPEGTVLSDHAVAVDAGRIVEVLPSREARLRYAPETLIERPDHIVLPGLVNAHTHAAMTLFRGMADDLPLMEWLTGHIWPAESRHMSERFVRLGTELAAAEMLRGGTTCFSDMYFYPDVCGEVAAGAGMRAVVGLIVIDAPTVWASDLDEYLAKATAVHDRFRTSTLVTTAFAPHAPYTVADSGLRRVATLAEELDIPVHMHVHETAAEVAEAVARTGKRPLERLAEHGLLSPRLVAVHMTALEEGEIAALAHHGGHVVHCPESNLKLASGFCPLGALLEHGVNVALGTDGAASNNDLDMLGETRTAALLAKGVSGAATAVPAERALTMATLGGARALGLGERVGSLLPGKEADIIALDLNRPETWPVYHPISQIVYSAGRDAVSDVWVGGEPAMLERRLVHIDVSEVLAEVSGWHEEAAGNEAVDR